MAGLRMFESYWMLSQTSCGVPDTPCLMLLLLPRLWLFVSLPLVDFGNFDPCAGILRRDDLMTISLCWHHYFLVLDTLRPISFVCAASAHG